MEDRKLKACPFCGKQPQLTPWTDDADPTGLSLLEGQIDCACGEFCFGSNNLTEQIKAWNTRTPSPESKACKKCGWIGDKAEIKSHEVTHAERFLMMCEESLCPETFEMLSAKIIPELEKARGIIITEKCPKCGQIDKGQMLRGEYPCSDCGLPTLHEEVAE